ncbi:MAG TPA: phosphoribosyltransferase [Candidatus Paceibacterota bacterium]|nr:phosphoribosyltransferase [Candidatus Paceibacterota bacterium]
MNSIRHCNGQTYIITHDLGERIQSLQSIGLRTPAASDDFFLGFNHGLKSLISEALPGVEVIDYDMKGLASEVWAESTRMLESITDSVFVSTCAEVASLRRGQTIEVNRIVDETGKIIGLGPRPGNPRLGEQIARIVAYADGRPIILTEDGAFSGYTVEYILKLLRARGARVAAVVLGLCFPGAKELFSKSFEGELVIVEKVDHPFEWMPDHDFVPFVPNCGRVYGGRFGKDVLPYYSHDGHAFSFPYVRPYGDPVDWASIPQEHAAELSRFCLQTSHMLYEILDKLNGRSIMMHDLLASKPRVCVPMSMGGNDLPQTDFCVSEYLSEVCQELA